MRALPSKTFEIVSSKGKLVRVVHEISAPTRRDAQDSFIGSAFEHQMTLRKKYPQENIVRSRMAQGHKNEISFTVDGIEVERWKLKERGAGVLVWLRNLLAGVA